MIQLSSILEHGNQVSLVQLLDEAREETNTTRKLIEQSAQDASAVKVLTIITLIFLPSTAVAVNVLSLTWNISSDDFETELLLHGLCESEGIWKLNQACCGR